MGNIYEYLYQTYGNKWNISNFRVTDLMNEGLLVGTIELRLGDRCITGSATVDRDFSLDVTQNLQAKCINSALIIYGYGMAKFTDSQINQVNEFKTKHNIDTDEKFNSYTNAWKRGATKHSLTPENIDDFLNFIRVTEKRVKEGVNGGE